MGFIKNTVILLIFCVFLLFGGEKNAFPLIVNQEILPADFVIHSITKDMEGNYIYIGGNRGIYVIYSQGAEKIETPIIIKNIRYLSVTKNFIYFLSDNGIYFKNKHDPASSWKRKNDLGDMKGIEIYDFDADKIVAWKNKVTYIVGPELNEKLKVMTGEGRIIKVSNSSDFLYLLTDIGCFYLDKKKNIFQKIRGFKTECNEDLFIDDSTTADLYFEKNSDIFCPDIDCTNNFALISSISGLYIFDPRKNKLDLMSLPGLPASKIRYVSLTDKTYLFSTLEAIYVAEKENNTFIKKFQKPDISDITALFSYQSKEGDEIVLAGAVNQFYRMILLYSEENKRKDNSAVIENVSIREVQKMAVEYAEVDPEKIRSWRNAAKIKAILPKISFGISESDDDNVEIYKSATKYYVVNGPREVDKDWNIDLTWDLSDLIWNDAQTSIDVRSKLMVQMRNDILEEVTRLYFERISILEEVRILSMDPGNKKELGKKKFRAKELTAYLDAYTGGKFSEKISQK